MKIVGSIGFILVGDCLLCWLFTSDVWGLGPFAGAAFLLAGLLAISYIGFLTIGDRSF
jgi:hypothetical protein